MHHHLRDRRAALDRQLRTFKPGQDFDRRAGKLRRRLPERLSRPSIPLRDRSPRCCQSAIAGFSTDWPPGQQFGQYVSRHERRRQRVLHEGRRCGAAIEVGELRQSHVCAINKNASLKKFGLVSNLAGSGPSEPVERSVSIERGGPDRHALESYVEICQRGNLPNSRFCQNFTFQKKH